MRFKVTLTAPVTLTATCELLMEAENADTAYEGALAEYERQADAYQKTLDEFHRTHKISYPDAPFYWQTNDADIETNLKEWDIEVDRAEPLDET